MSIIGRINFGSLTEYLFFFANGSSKADWKDSKHGYLGNVAVDGLTANLHTNSNVPYAGTICTNDNTLGVWETIVTDNAGQAFESLNQVGPIAQLKADLVNTFSQINALPVTSGYESRDAASLDGLNTQNGTNEVFVINITSGFDVSAPIYITGDPGDVYILRWDEDADPTNGYQGNVKFWQGGGIVPQGGLMPSNFIHVAGQIDAAGGGSTPPVPYPQGPRYNDGTGALIVGGSDWTSGGFFTGYWLTTGEPTTQDPDSGLYYGVTHSLSNAVFVGGWYTITTEFELTAQSGGVYTSPNPDTVSTPKIEVQKYVSADGGATWLHAEDAPGPDISSNVSPQFKFTVTNTGDVPLSLVSLSDSVYGSISVGGYLAVGDSFDSFITLPWSEGQHENEATATGAYNTVEVSDSDFSHYVGVPVGEPAVQLVKYVSVDGGATWLDAHTPPGPDILSNEVPKFKFEVTNTGTAELTNVTVTDDKFGYIGSIGVLPLGASQSFLYVSMWEEGQHVNTATVHTAQGVCDESQAYYNGVVAMPAIAIKKYVSPDGGLTWEDADVPPGPTISPDVQPQFKFVVTNTGNVTLFDISVTDDVFGLIGLWVSLKAGDEVEQVMTAPWQEGLHENTATVTANFIVEPLMAQDKAFYTGAETPKPSVSIVKYVSVDDGVTWIHATTSPGPLLPKGMTARFKYVVTNTGNEPLTNINVTDSVIGDIASVAELPVGASQTWVV